MARIHPPGPSRTLKCHQKRRDADQRHQPVFLHCKSRFQHLDRIQSQFPAQSIRVSIHQHEKEEHGGESSSVDSHQH